VGCPRRAGSTAARKFGCFAAQGCVGLYPGRLDHIMRIGESLLSVAEEFFSTVDTLGIPRSRLPNISQAIDRSATAIQRAHAALCPHELFHTNGIAVAVFGSLARHELTICSDLDYLFIVEGPKVPSPQALNAAVDKLRSGLVDGVVLDQPLTDAFGTTVELDEIITRIGLQQDDNYNLTRRMLLLEESVYLTDDQVRHAHLVRLLEQYAAGHGPHNQRFPRALLDDIVRYWRTVAVDACAFSASGPWPYSRRYLKMMIPRKLNYISSIAPLFLFNTSEETDYVSFMADAFMRPPMIRLARLLAKITSEANPGNQGLSKIGQDIFIALDAFIAKSGDRCWRDSIERQCQDIQPQDAPEFCDMQRLGSRLHSQIAELLLSDAMLPFTQEYLLV
jgi:predicted nucleotidyltransferase